MAKRAFLTAVAVLLALPAGLSSLAEEPPAKIQGEVIQVMQRVQTANAGEMDALRIRTRQGEEMQLLLGKAGSCPDCVQPGDQVRVRLAASGPTDGGYQVRTMQIRRTGETLEFRNAAGELQQVRSRNRHHDGTGPGEPAQMHGQNHGSGARDSGAARGNPRGAGSPGGGRR